MTSLVTKLGLCGFYKITNRYKNDDVFFFLLDKSLLLIFCILSAKDNPLLGPYQIFPLCLSCHQVLFLIDQRAGTSAACNISAYDIHNFIVSALIDKTACVALLVSWCCKYWKWNLRFTFPFARRNPLEIDTLQQNGSRKRRTNEHTTFNAWPMKHVRTSGTDRILTKKCITRAENFKK